MLNSNTDVKSIPDKGKRKCLFEVTCGHTGTPFEIFADDQKMKHEWMLAIRKVSCILTAFSVICHYICSRLNSAQYSKQRSGAVT